jgi:methylase of polypeptide subunit release factors
MKWLKRLREEQRPIRFLLSRLLRLIRLCYFFTIRKDGYRLRFYPTAVSATAWVDPSPFREELFIAKVLKRGDIYVDVGANIGALACKAASMGCEVYAFEAHPRTFRFLKGNIRLNGFDNVVAINKALSDKSGTVRFSDLYSDEARRRGGGETCYRRSAANSRPHSHDLLRA